MSVCFPMSWGCFMDVGGVAYCRKGTPAPHAEKHVSHRFPGGTSMQAVFEGAVIANADDADVVVVEGDRYFPPTAITEGVLQAAPPADPSSGDERQHYSIRVGEQDHEGLAWAYLHPAAEAVERAGVDFSGYVAFAPAVTVREGVVPQEGALP